ncbi:hypothetical protein KFL_001580140 [Klebsormidium nitens]|uniref:Putative restriction endonuclease domain-containing protein n=1 Tax=Klebsormidium nitens TaxID=105231 RepID=A0A1Y1HYG7_KLENI|nr:hypothetical protein KFL_001580140 [Klebsormidium nitens]|eukprot:GAQ83700.1 hypothetical protein KFL_001580140 [Klebsormidium nitens]
MSTNVVSGSIEHIKSTSCTGRALDLNFFPSHLPALFETYSERLEIRAYTWTDDDLVLFHQCNPRLRIERLANGRVSVKPADGANVEALQEEILRQLRSWNEERSPERGRCFTPPGGFFLPVVKSQRSPQVAFTGRNRWHLQMVGKPIGGLLVRACPQLCVEVATSKETLEEARAKAKEYLIAGCELVWIFYAEKNVVFVYRREFDEDFVVNPTELRGDPFLPNFVLRVDELRAKGVWF